MDLGLLDGAVCKHALPTRLMIKIWSHVGEDDNMTCKMSLDFHIHTVSYEHIHTQTQIHTCN